MSQGVITVQASGFEKNGQVNIPSHWYFILKAYGQCLPGTKLVCRKDEVLGGKATMPIPEGLEPVLLDNLDSSDLTVRIKGYFDAYKKIKALVKDAGFVGAVLPSILGNMTANIAISYKKPLFVEIAGESKLYDKKLSYKLPFRLLSFWYIKRIDSQVLRHANLLFYVSKHLINNSKYKPITYSIVPHTTIYKSDLFRRDDTCTCRPIKILSANRIVREKGLQNLLIAIKKLREDMFDVEAVLVGDGEYLSELIKQRSELGLDAHVTFPGYISAGQELWQMYRQADLMVLPTLASGEGTPKCIIEAMAASCPVIAYSVGGIKLMLEEADSGTLVAPGNISELVKAMKQVITNSDLRKKYIFNGLSWVSGATMERRQEIISHSLSEYLIFK